MGKGRILGAALAAMLTSAGAVAEGAGSRTPAPEQARAWIVQPADGAEVPPTFKVVFGLSGFGVAPAGVDVTNTGHHHLLIDTELENYDAPVPSDAHHRHFGKGQTETTLTLEPGEHTLQLVMGDHLHRPHAPPITSEVIRITVVAP
jgi:hypothetical protein